MDSLSDGLTRDPSGGPIQQDSRPAGPGRVILWEAPFRPFFIGAAVMATLMILPWLADYLTRWHWAVPGGAVVWHMHEMVFGFGVAAAGGYLSTVLARWTGRPPWRGRTLAVVWGGWLIARLVALLPLALPAPVTLVLLVLPTMLIAVRVMGITFTRADRRHAVFGGAVLALLATQVAFVAVWLDLAPTAWVASRVEPVAMAGLSSPLRWLGDVGLMLLMLIHSATISRVIRRLGPEALALSGRGRPFRFDAARARLTSLTLGLFIAALALLPGSAAVGWLAWAAAAAQIDRLRMIWVGRAARHSFVHGLYLAKMFLIAALVLFGAARLLDLPWMDAAWHAGAAGTVAVGCLTLFGVVSRRHTRGAMPLPPMATAAIWLAAAGAVTRVAAPFAWGSVGLASMLFWIAALLWSGAFAVFLVGHSRSMIWAIREPMVGPMVGPIREADSYPR